MRVRLVLLASTVTALLLLLAVAAGAAPPSETNKNGGTVEMTCDGSPVTVWVNFVASDMSGQTPAHIVAGVESRVFKVTSFSIDGGESFYLHFPAPEPPFTLVECSHPSPWGNITLVGALIP